MRQIGDPNPNRGHDEQAVEAKDTHGLIPAQRPEPSRPPDGPHQRPKKATANDEQVDRQFERHGYEGLVGATRLMRTEITTRATRMAHSRIRDREFPAMPRKVA